MSKATIVWNWSCSHRPITSTDAARLRCFHRRDGDLRRKRWDATVLNLATRRPICDCDESGTSYADIAGFFVETGTYSEDHNRAVTIRELVRRWLESRAGEVKDGTLDGYQRAANNIVGPLLLGTTQQRARRTLTGKHPEGTKTTQLLGKVKVQDLSTSDIRTWHKTLVTEVGWYGESCENVSGERPSTGS